ncbi:MAG: sodium:solute symporter family protein [Synergistaceae bacterium]|nr:sodium:solute symporter family protein [Synergistaceae bacterium]
MYLFHISAFVLLALFVGAGLITGRSGGGKKDYSLGGRSAGAAGVTGILLGALVGGASTVGTVQMAYSYGLTAWWFTLGGGIGCLLLGLRFAAPLRDSGVATIADYIERSYGGHESRCASAIAFTVTVSSSIGAFISICAQFLACIALIRGAFPISPAAAALVAAVSVWGFIAVGGMKSFSTLGEAKIVLLYIALLLCAGAALFQSGGLAPLARALGFNPWFNLFGRGFVPEAGYLVSMIVGVFTTQIYIQSLAAAKDARTARAGAFASALLMPPMGLLGTLIGLSVRARGVEIAPDQVLSWFIMESFPPLAGGLLWGGILITVVGCAAGLILGIATNISRNFIPRRIMEKYASKNSAIQQLLVLAMIVTAALSGLGGAGSMILEWSFMSMGLRGAGTFFPFVLAVLKPGLLSPRRALASCVGGLAAMLLWAFLGLKGDPLFAGLAFSALCTAPEFVQRRKYLHRSHAAKERSSTPPPLRRR